MTGKYSSIHSLISCCFEIAGARLAWQARALAARAPLAETGNIHAVSQSHSRWPSTKHAGLDFSGALVNSTAFHAEDLLAPFTRDVVLDTR